MLPTAGKLGGGGHWSESAPAPCHLWVLERPAGLRVYRSQDDHPWW